VAVDQLQFDFMPQNSGDPATIAAAPTEGAFCRSMILEGARWDYESSCLADAEPMQLYGSVPIFLFKPIAKKKAADINAVYQCPLYYFPNRTGSPTRPSFQIWVEVKSGQYTPGFWVKRGTAFLLTTG